MSPPDRPDLGRLVVVPFGPAATAALAAGVRAAQGADPLAAVDVVVPSSAVGVAVRRAVAENGTANVRFSSFPQLAERLAARHLALTGRRVPGRGARDVAARAALARSVGEVGRAAGRQAATATKVEKVLAELDEVEAHRPGALDRLSTGGTRYGRELAAIYHDYRAALAGADLVDGHDAAVEALESGDAPGTHVILFAPLRLPPAQRRLLVALADAGRLTVVLAVTGEEQDPARELLPFLTGVLGPATHAPADRDVTSSDGPGGDRPGAHVLSSHGPGGAGRGAASAQVRIAVAPDAEEEARSAVRTVLAHLEAHPVRPERVAIAYRAASPHVRLLRGALDEAGLPYHSPAPATLAQTLAGRTLVGLLDLHRDDMPRADVIRWLSDAPVLDACGRLVPAARWDRLSRDAHVGRGSAAWQRLADLSDQESATATRTADPGADPTVPVDRQTRDRAEDAGALATMVAGIGAAAERVVTSDTWGAVVTSLHAAAIRFLGADPTADAGRWHPRPEAPAVAARQAGVERLAVAEVLAAVEELRLRDHAGPAPSPERVRTALADALDRPAPTGTTLGHGILLAPVDRLVGATVDLLVVVGMTEDAYPPRAQENPVLRDADRALVGVRADGTAPLTTADRRRTDRRAHRATLAGARMAVLGYAVTDTRGQRRQFPAPWLLEEATRLCGAPVSAEALPTLSGRDWLVANESFVASLRAATRTATLLSRHEVDVAAAQAAGVSWGPASDPTPAPSATGDGGRGGSGDAAAREGGTTPDTAAPTDAAPRFRRGRHAVRARAAGEFGPWLGQVPPLTGPLAERAARASSATALERFATCPASYLFRHVWQVGELEDVGDQDTVDPRDRGTLVHRALEAFLTDHVPTSDRRPRSPDAAWTPEEVADAQRHLTEAAERLEASGVTGRPELWRAEVASLRRRLATVLAQDNALRRELRSWPVAVEMAFGRGGAPPLHLTLDDGREVTFAGTVDRVDRTEDGSLVVIDYKTGTGSRYAGIPSLGKAAAEPTSTPDTDLTDRGRKIQLVLYALAAEAALGGKTSQAFYWFVERGARRGGPIDDVQRARLRRALGVVRQEIAAGRFPANPGSEDHWSGWESCGFCPYDRLCPVDRGGQWDLVARDRRLAAYVALTTGTPPEEARR